MSATQELSQWVREPPIEASNVENTLSYAPGQPGYVGFEDLEIGNTQIVSQADITPNVETRIERYPESKRFAEPETPIPGGKINLGRNSSGSNEFQTPQLPTNPFLNPFVNGTGEEHGGMGLTQVFKATQAGSSPNVLRRPHIPSSQRPSPHVVTRNVFDIPSDLVSEHLSGGVDLQEISGLQEASSPTDSIISRASAEHEGENHGNEGDQLAEAETHLDQEPGIHEQKGSRKSNRRAAASSAIHKMSDARIPTRDRKAKVAPDAGLFHVENAGNTSEEETELDDNDDDDDEDVVERPHEDDSEGDKENRFAQLSHEPRFGFGIKRAPQAAPNPSIPFSSSPMLARHHQQGPRNDTNNAYQEQPSSNSDEMQIGTHKDGQHYKDGQHFTIADSQSSQKPNTNLPMHNPRQLAGSSNDSRRIIPQSQAVKPQSSLHVTSTASKPINLASQQTLSPPESSSGSRHNLDRDVVEAKKSTGEIARACNPVSPNSSPPLLLRSQEHEQIAIKNIDENKDENRQSDTNLAGRESSTLVRRTPALRGARFASKIPETTFHNRHTDGFPPDALYDEVNLSHGLEDVEPSFQGSFRRDNGGLVENRSLAASFGSRPSENTSKHAQQISPARPKAFSALVADQSQSQSQEPESLEFAVFNTQDREIYDAISRHPGTESSPLAVGRKRRRGNNRAPILLDEISSDDVPSRDGKQSPTRAVAQRQQSVFIEAEHKPIEGEISPAVSRPSTREQSEDVVDNAIPFLDLPTPSKTYSKKRKRLPKSRDLPSTMPLVKKAPEQRVTRKQGRSAKASSVSLTPSCAVSSKPSRSRNIRDLGFGTIDAGSLLKPQDSMKATPFTSYTTARTQQSTARQLQDLDDGVKETSFLVPKRVFAKFRGSSPGYFAATCLDCFDNELEKRHNVRFDDGTIDHLGQVFVKRLEFHIGDEVKVDRRQMKSSTFIVQGFGSKVDGDALLEDDYPTTDVHGHETIKLVEKLLQGSKKISKPVQELEIPVTEIFFTIGMWSSIKNRDYNHPAVKLQSNGTPTMIRMTSNFNSPQSRTRSTNKINISGLTTTSFNAKAAKIITPIIAASGLFKSIAFVVTGVQPTERDDLIRTIARHGGLILDGFQELFEVPEARLLSDTSSVQNDDPNHKESKTGSSGTTKPLQLRSGYTNIRLAVLVSEKANRNTKYFQALALGIPCLSFQWIKHCLQAGKLKNWRPYMLAAGKSTILLSSDFGTSCSQQLNLTHEEMADPNLSLNTIVSRRPQWLQNARVLIIGNGENEGMPRSQAHAFLISFLGASQVVIAEHLEQAEQHLAKEKHEFQWICRDNEAVKENPTSRGERRARRSSNSRRTLMKGLDGIEQVQEISVKLVLESLIVGSLLNQEDVKEQDE